MTEMNQQVTTTTTQEAIPYFLKVTQYFRDKEINEEKSVSFHEWSAFYDSLNMSIEIAKCVKNMSLAIDKLGIPVPLVKGASLESTGFKFEIVVPRDFSATQRNHVIQVYADFLIRHDLLDDWTRAI